MLLCAGLLLTAGAVRAQSILSDFNLNADGWHAYTAADPNTVVVYTATGGTNGSGAIILQEPANGANDYFDAPAKFLGNQSAFYGGSLSFDLKLSLSWNGTEADMVVLTGNGTSIAYSAPQANWPVTTNYTSYSFKLDGTQGWTLAGSSTLATTQQISSVLGNLSDLRILGDWTNSQDNDLLDNVQFAPVPEPGTVSLLALGGALLLGAALRRGTQPAA